MLSDSLAKEFEAIVGKENVFTSEADRQNYAYDSCVWAPCIPGGVVRPTRTEQLGPIIELCYKEGLPMTVRGAGTNLSGGTRSWAGLPGHHRHHRHSDHRAEPHS